MSLVLTRRAGEAVILLRPGPNDTTLVTRICVVSVDRGVVRVSVDATDEVKIVREELLVAGAGR